MPLPASLVNARVAAHVEFFLDWYHERYADAGGDLGTPLNRREDTEGWGTPCATILPVRGGSNERYARLDVTLRDLPGIVAFAEDDSANPPYTLAWEHRFAVMLPAGYPQSLAFRFTALTPTIHPRLLPPEEGAPACAFPGGEVDAVLRHLVWAVLLHPVSVSPPSLVPGADKGYRPDMMDHIEALGPDRLHADLLGHWRRRLLER